MVLLLETSVHACNVFWSSPAPIPLLQFLSHPSDHSLLTSRVPPHPHPRYWVFLGLTVCTSSMASQEQPHWRKFALPLLAAISSRWLISQGWDFITTSPLQSLRDSPAGHDSCELVHMCNCLVLSWKHCSIIAICHLIWSFCPLFWDDPWTFGGGLWYRCSI